MTPEELEQEANRNLSNFEGEGDNYDGSGDDHVDFGGIRKSFASVIGADRIFTMNVENTGLVDLPLILSSPYSFDEAPAGYVIPVDGTLGSITGSGSPKRIQNFRQFTYENPTLIKGFKIKAKNSSDQLEQQMVLQPLSPFKTLESRQIPLSAYQDENTFQDKTVTVPEEFVMSNQLLMWINILAGEKITMTFFAGAVYNTSVALVKKNERAKAVFQRKGITIDKLKRGR